MGFALAELGVQHNVGLGTVATFDLKPKRMWLTRDIRHVGTGSPFVGNHCFVDGKLISGDPATLPQLKTCLSEEFYITPSGVLSFL